MMFAFGIAFISAVAATEIKHCSWLDGKLEVSWSAPEEPADYYEVQVANEAGGSTFAVYSTEADVAELDFLKPTNRYWLKVRAHKANMPSLGPGTWLQPGSQVECKTGSASNKSSSDASPTSPESMMLEVMRESEYTYDVDYLMNHNSGDISGDCGFIQASSGDPDKPSFLNVTFRKSVFTLYCVEMLAPSSPGKVTTDGDDRFADYLSCDDNNNATNPLCGCDNFIDRFFSKSEDQLKYCHTKAGAQCSTPKQFKDCTCNCTASSLDNSQKYTGMSPLYFGQSELIGHWYSHPSATECREKEAVGAVRADGTQCTWKRRREARVLRGDDALKFGWNTTGVPHKSHSDPDVAQIRQNAGVMRDLFDSQPYKQWSCSTPAGSSRATTSALIV